METIKISVEVSVNLSENTQNFIKSLFASNASVAPVASEQKPASKVSAKPVQKLAAPTVVPAQTKPAVAPASGVPAASSASKSIEDVRKMLAQKVNEHRDVIKQKLTEFGAPSVTKLDPAKYDEMYNFLESL